MAIVSVTKQTQVLPFPCLFFKSDSSFFFLSHPVFPGFIHLLPVPGILYAKAGQLSGRWGRSWIHYPNSLWLDHSGSSLTTRQGINYSCLSRAADLSVAQRLTDLESLFYRRIGSASVTGQNTRILIARVDVSRGTGICGCRVCFV